jgi:hypothetical protein
MKDLTLYCICHQNKENKSFQFNQKNLMCGSVYYEENYKKYIEEQNFILDERGDNISSLNPFFGQLCGLYWSWKNDSSEWIGTNTYRIFWDNLDLISKEKRDNIIFIPERFCINDLIYDPLTGSRPMNTYDQYQFYHGSIGWSLLYGLCKTTDLPIKMEMIDDLKKQNYIYPFNMFISHRNLYNKLCEILFEILFEFYNKYQHIIPKIQEHHNQIRLIDYLAERILHIIYMNNSYYFNNINIEPIKTIQFSYTE